jgi:hypothetical protein
MRSNTMNELNWNWKQIASSITAALTTLAVIPYDLYEGTLKHFASFVPPSWKPTIILAGLFTTIVLRLWNAATQPPK